MRVRYAVTIAGSHGKTTTTSLVATVLRAAGLDPDRRRRRQGQRARLERAPRRGRPLRRRGRRERRLLPQAHAHHRRRDQHRRRAPRPLRHARARSRRPSSQHANRVPFYGLCVLCLDHPQRAGDPPAHRAPARHLRHLARRPTTAPRTPRFEGLATHFDAFRRRRAPRRRSSSTCRARTTCSTRSPSSPWPTSSRSRSTSRATPSPPSTASSAASRCWASPRFTKDGKRGDVMIVDDYGHHPAEIEATLDAAQRGFDRRVVVAFQPHRYTRTQLALRRVHARLQQGRRPPRHRCLPRGRAAHRRAPPARRSREAIRAHGHHAVTFVRDKKARRQALLEVVEPGDIVIALGAGDINASARELLAMLSPKEPPA